MKQLTRKELKGIIKRAMAENEDWEERYKQVSRESGLTLHEAECEVLRARERELMKEEIIEGADNRKEFEEAIEGAKKQAEEAKEELIKKWFGKVPDKDKNQSWRVYDEKNKSFLLFDIESGMFSFVDMFLSTQFANPYDVVLAMGILSKEYKGSKNLKIVEAGTNGF
ncbi:MAG: hypothetical protein LE169_06000 [Endomicrobium sp.]|nr:hypothetical protein [Endomicrobium sp.]